MLRRLTSRLALGWNRNLWPSRLLLCSSMSLTPSTILIFFSSWLAHILTMMLQVLNMTHFTRLWCSTIAKMTTLWLSSSFREHVNNTSVQFCRLYITWFRTSNQIGIHHLSSLTMLRLKLIHYDKLFAFVLHSFICLFTSIIVSFIVINNSLVLYNHYWCNMAIF